jgi:hypothetical protein
MSRTHYSTLLYSFDTLVFTISKANILQNKVEGERYLSFTNKNQSKSKKFCTCPNFRKRVWGRSAKMRALLKSSLVWALTNQRMSQSAQTGLLISSPGSSLRKSPKPVQSVDAYLPDLLMKCGRLMAKIWSLRRTVFFSSLSRKRKSLLVIYSHSLSISLRRLSLESRSC